MPYKDPEAHRAYHAAYREAKRELIRLKNRLYAATHKPQRRLYDAAHIERRRASQNAAYAANPERFKAKQHADRVRRNEEIRARDRAYCALHKEKRNARQRAARQRRQEAIRLRDRAYYVAHRDAELAAKHRYHRAHREAILTYKKMYQAANPLIIAAIRRRRRARKAAAPVNDLSAAQWQEIQASQDHCCAYCGIRCKGKLTQDHILPLSQGGSHTFTNVIAACRVCNSRKNTGPPLCPVQPLLLTIAPSKKKKAS